MIYAKAGEKVTREDGEPVCTVARDIIFSTDPSPVDLTDWLIEPSERLSKSIDPPGRRWWRNADPPSSGFDLHLERGWGSETKP